jgi:hypothetical protein
MAVVNSDEEVKESVWEDEKNGYKAGLYSKFPIWEALVGLLHEIWRPFEISWHTSFVIIRFYDKNIELKLLTYFRS